MAQEPGSTVKHVNWVWPDCLVGDGAPNNNDSARGAYNVRCLLGNITKWLLIGNRYLSARTSG